MKKPALANTLAIHIGLLIKIDKKMDVSQLYDHHIGLLLVDNE